MPVLGLGVYRSEPGAATRAAVLSALQLGYRHIDTAQFYANEADCGEAVRAAADAGITRDQVWITSKILPQTWSNPSTAFERTKAAVQQSLQRIGFPSIDLMLLHAPGPAEGRAEAWRALEEAQQQGLLRSIGVSNFGIGHLDKLASSASITPAVNQIELHPWLQWRELVQHCKGRGIVLQAYSPLAKASKLNDPTVAAIAQRRNKTPAQVLIRWSLQHGFVPLPKSVNAQRQAVNADVFDWQLTGNDMAALDGLEQDLVTGWDPIRSHEV
ncbi:hypothetical protein OEZ85_003977 [Tetradesmus obliquus]|uniref:NADP-dependent oxidoreductase domain-containing protein n=1 Tax=Tetradesmus obliquus TaxID=3088 RepID=A0ABY8UCZ3_TETOB|nr:hypothetical protein OEZ85_003977 [Tetradesmus obliquus]